jgi:alanine dehydrogenase
MVPKYIDRELIASQLPMRECISVMEKMFMDLSSGKCIQPLRSLMRLPGNVGLLGMMPGYAKNLGIMGIKVISVFPKNSEAGFASHQGVVILFDARHGEPLMIFDANEITAIRTAAVSALATRILSKENADQLAIIGSGQQAEKHIEAILCVRKIRQIRIWSRNKKNASVLAAKTIDRYSIATSVVKDVKHAVADASIVCTVTSSSQPLLFGNWIGPGTHINAVGASTPTSRELDTAAIVKSKLFTDCYESLFNEAGDFLIPKKEGAIGDDHVRGDLGQILKGDCKGREHNEEITVFKSLGIAAEDIFSAWHIFQKLNHEYAVAVGEKAND